MKAKLVRQVLAEKERGLLRCRQPEKTPGSCLPNHLSISAAPSPAPLLTAQAAFLLVLIGIAVACLVLVVRVFLAQAGTVTAGVDKLLIRKLLIHNFPMGLLVQSIL